MLTGVGTDGGIALGNLATFAHRDRVDDAVDGRVTSVIFQGRTFDLTVNSSGRGPGFTYTITDGNALDGRRQRQQPRFNRYGPTTTRRPRPSAEHAVTGRPRHTDWSASRRIHLPTA